LSTLDPFTAEIIRHKLLSVAKQIEINITRTAYSPLVYEVKDYAVGIVDGEGRLIAESGGGIPLFVADALGVGVRDGLAVHGRANIHPGDVLISNHAGTLGQHLNNVIMYTPVFAGGALAGFMAIIVHWIDVGGSTIGSAAPTGTTEIFQEGFQFRSIKLWSRGQRVDDIYRTIELNTRLPRMLFGDIEAQLAGCLLGRDLVAALVERYSLEAFRAAIELIWARAETVARNAIRAIPDGAYAASSFLDDDGYRRGEPVPIAVEVRVHGDELTVDLSGVAGERKGAMNSGRFGGAVTAARLAFKYLCAPFEPANDGLYRPLHLEIPDGTFLSASATAPMSKYSFPLPTVIDTIVKALVPALPHAVAAGHHANFAMHGFSGRDPVSGEVFFALNGLPGGWGAGDGFDGPGPYKTMSHGDTQEVPVEVQEALFPVRVERLALCTDSGGAGTYRGGLGVEKVVTALAPLVAAMGFERTKCAPWGIRGGGDGAVPSVALVRNGSEPVDGTFGEFALVAGDRLEMRTAGGGGYGDPQARERSSVERDVRLGYVSPAAAREVYGATSLACP
jgi:N-methylhydantoinase B